MTYTLHRSDVVRTTAGPSRTAKFFRRLVQAHIASRMKAVERELRWRGLIEATAPTDNLSRARRPDMASPRPIENGSDEPRRGVRAKRGSLLTLLQGLRRIGVAVVQAIMDANAARAEAVRRDFKERYPYLDLS